MGVGTDAHLRFFVDYNNVNYNNIIIFARNKTGLTLYRKPSVLNIPVLFLY